MNQNSGSKQLNTAQKVDKILSGDASILLKESKELGTKLASLELSNTQIRNIYSIIKRISSSGQFEDAEQRELKLLVPKIQYAIAREQKSPEGWASLGEILEKCILRIEGDHTKFIYFTEFFEAIVAYHYSEHTKRKKVLQEQEFQKKQSHKPYKGGR